MSNEAPTDALRLAVHESNIRLEEFRRVISPEALAALKSTAAKEGEGS